MALLTERFSRFINMSLTSIHGPLWPEAGYWIYESVSDLEPWSLMAWAGYWIYKCFSDRDPWFLMSWIGFLDLYIWLWPGSMVLDGLNRVSGFIHLSLTCIHGPWWAERVSRFINLSLTSIHGPLWPEAGFWIYKRVSNLDPWSLMTWAGFWIYKCVSDLDP